MIELLPVMSVANDNELNSLDLSTIKPGTVIIVEQPKPARAFVYSNGEFIRFFDRY